MDDFTDRSPYFERLKKEYEKEKESVIKARNRLNSKNLTAEEIYGKIGEAIEKSPIRESSSRNRSSNIPRPTTSPSPENTNILQTIPVDKERRIEIRKNPRVDSLQYAAVKEFEQMPSVAHRTGNEDFAPYDVPRKVNKDIASLDIFDDGRVSFVRSSYPGAKEEAIDRLLMEAAKRDMTPHSSNLLAPGKKLVARKIKEYQEIPKEKYLQKIADFLSTGKTGKIWSTASTIAKPVATGAGILGALTAPDIASAAADIAIPGGVESMGVSEEQKELDKKYVEKLREMSKRNKK